MSASAASCLLQVQREGRFYRAPQRNHETTCSALLTSELGFPNVDGLRGGEPQRSQNQSSDCKGLVLSFLSLRPRRKVPVRLMTPLLWAAWRQKHMVTETSWQFGELQKERQIRSVWSSDSSFRKRHASRTHLPPTFHETPTSYRSPTSPTSGSSWGPDCQHKKPFTMEITTKALFRSQ